MSIVKIKFEDLEIGQHFWGVINNKVAVFAKFDNERPQICGAWECGVDKNQVKILKLIKTPKNYEIYYL